MSCSLLRGTGHTSPSIMGTAPGDEACNDSRVSLQGLPGGSLLRCITSPARQMIEWAARAGRKRDIERLASGWHGGGMWINRGRYGEG